jgi:type II secretory pathway pseudopilin PulG
MTKQFTFLELMVVVCMVSVVLAISTPRLGEFYRSLRLAQSARQVMIVHNATRDLAASTGAECRLILSADRRSLRVAKIASPPAAPVVLEPIEGRLGRWVLPPGVSLVRVVRNRQELTPGVEVAWDVAPWGGMDDLLFVLIDDSGAQQHIEIADGG